VFGSSLVFDEAKSDLDLDIELPDELLVDLETSGERRLDGEGALQESNETLTNNYGAVLALHCSFSKSIYELCTYQEELPEGLQYDSDWIPSRGDTLMKILLLTSEGKSVREHEYDHGNTTLAMTYLDVEISLARCYSECARSNECTYMAYNEDVRLLFSHLL
jgi:hypothetical protein